MQEDLIARYVNAGDVIRRKVVGLSEAQAKPPTSPGQWSIQELVIHLADSDAIAIDRMKRILAEDRPEILNFNETAYIELLHPHEQSLDDAVELFVLGRRQFARVLAKLTEVEWRRIGAHNIMGEITVLKILTTITEHAEHHLKFLDGKRQTLGLLLSGSGS